MPRKKPSGYEMHVISNTHWDREWRHPFQYTRMMLVDVMDTLLDILEKQPEYKCYHLDSQTIMIEDYLEIRPEKEAQIREFVKKGRIMAGPWYTCADMNVLSGEAIVRNLLLGHKIARSFGKVMKVGYTPFSFGHVAQLPQIYAGFDIDSCMFYRGVGRDRAKAEFWWEAPDGTRVLTSQFSRRGRYNFYFHVYRPVVDGRAPNVVAMDWQEIGQPMRCSDVPNQYNAVYAMDRPPKLRLENIAPGIEALIAEDESEFTTPYFLLMQGCDTTAPNPAEPLIIAEADKCLKEHKVLHSSLPEYIKKLQQAVGKLPVLEGEMRVPAQTHSPAVVLLDTISTRIYLKQANLQNQNAIEKWAEPMAVAAWRFGAAYPSPYLELAWRNLLANQAHDSIAGCGVDEVHEEMMHRFGQATQIADEVSRRSLASITKQIACAELPPEGSLLTCWNSLTRPRGAVVPVTIDFPQSRPPKYFGVEDQKGNPVPLQVSHFEDLVASVQLRADWPQISNVRRYTAYVHLDEIPAMGYKALRVVTDTEQKDSVQTYFDKTGLDTRAKGSLVTGDRVMENEHIRVAINPNGAITLTHKESGKTYENLHYFEDGGECGTAWERDVPQKDRVVNSLGAPAVVTLETEGPLLSTYRIDYQMAVPAMSDAESRSDQAVELAITSRMTLKKGSKRLEIQTKVHNTARNHYLRVLFPTRLKTDVSYADRPFDVIERPIALPDSTHWTEKVRGTHPHVSWAELNDGSNGFALLCNGLPEYGVSDDPSRTMALTLLRTVHDVNKAFAFEPPKKEGLQCLGVQEYRYAIYPHTGDWNEGNVYDEAEAHNVPVRAMQSGRTDKGTLPKQLSLVEINPTGLVFSGMKKAEKGNGVILRLFNPTDRQVSGTIKVHWPVTKAHETNLEEKRLAPLAVTKDHNVKVKVPKKKIVTVELQLGR